MAGKQSDGILEILFGVKGGGSVSGASGVQISKDLAAIAKNIHPEIQFRLSKNQQSTFQAELDAIAKNLKLNIEANVTNVKMPDGSGAGGAGGGKTGKGGVTAKVRSAQIALNEYKKALSSIRNVQNALMKSTGSGVGADSERRVLQAKLDLLEEYASKQAEIIAQNGTRVQQEKLAIAQTAGNLKDETARYDVVIQKVKEYSNQLQSLRDKYGKKQTELDVNATVGALRESSANPSMDGAEQQKRIAQAEQLSRAYDDALNAVSALDNALAHPQTQFGSDEEAQRYIQNLSVRLEEAKQKTEAFRQAFSGAKKTLNGDAESLRLDKAFAGASKSAEEFYAKYKRLINANDEFSRKWSELLTKLRNQQFKGPDEATTAVRNLITETTRAGVTVETFGRKLQRAFGTHFLTAITAIASNTLRKALREIYQNVVELDDALTEFSIVSGKTGNDLSDFADKAFESAQRLRAGVTDVIDAATVYSRLGFTDQESMKYAELTTMFSKVGDVEISDAESNITAIIKAYDVGADQLELALDKIVKTGKQNCPAA